MWLFAPLQRRYPARITETCPENLQGAILDGVLGDSSQTFTFQVLDCLSDPVQGDVSSLPLEERLKYAKNLARLLSVPCISVFPVTSQLLSDTSHPLMLRSRGRYGEPAFKWGSLSLDLTLVWKWVDGERGKQAHLYSRDGFSKATAYLNVDSLSPFLPSGTIIRFEWDEGKLQAMEIRDDKTHPDSEGVVLANLRAFGVE
jgi:hypothetical protein